MDIMIDLETLGTNPDCVVISLGACLFDINKKSIGPTFYMALDIKDQIEKGRELDADTLKWWMGQDGAAKKVFNEQAKPTLLVLNTFSQWLQANVPSQKERKVWGNGSSFDISIMESLYRTYGVKCPWGYNNVMDLRTFKRFMAKGVQVKKSGTNHNALDDALSQAQYVLDNVGY